MPTTLEVVDDCCVIRLEGEIGINSAEELKRALVNGLSMRRPIRVDLVQASDLDITCIQLIWAAVRDAAKGGIATTPFQNVPERIRSAALDAGFVRFLESPVKLE